MLRRLCIAAALGLVAYGIARLQGPAATSPAPLTADVAQAGPLHPSATPRPESPAGTWAPDAVAAPDAAPASPAPPDALWRPPDEVLVNAFEVDGTGQLRIGPDTLTGLRLVLSQMPGDADAAQISTVQRRLREALPGVAGDRAAALLAALLDYQRVEAQFSLEDFSTPARAAASEARLAEARNRQFGAEDAALMFAAARPDEAEPPAVAARDDPAAQRMRATRDEWARRYAAYRGEAAPILAAGLDEAERQRQLDALRAAHYAEHEASVVRAMDAAGPDAGALTP